MSPESWVSVQLCYILSRYWATQEVKSMGPLLRRPNFEPLQVISCQASISSSASVEIID